MCIRQCSRLVSTLATSLLYCGLRIRIPLSDSRYRAMIFLLLVGGQISLMGHACIIFIIKIASCLKIFSVRILFEDMPYTDIWRQDLLLTLVLGTPIAENQVLLSFQLYLSLSHAIKHVYFLYILHNLFSSTTLAFWTLFWVNFILY